MPEEIVFLSFTTIVAVTGLGFGLMRTVSKHLERKHGGGRDLSSVRAEIEDLLATQSDGMDDLRARLADLEERIDFTERILARSNEDQALPPRS